MPASVRAGALVRLYVPLAVPYFIVAPLGVPVTPEHVNALPSYTLDRLDIVALILHFA